MAFAQALRDGELPVGADETSGWELAVEPEPDSEAGVAGFLRATGETDGNDPFQEIAPEQRPEGWVLWQAIPCHPLVVPPPGVRLQPVDLATPLDDGRVLELTYDRGVCEDPPPPDDVGVSLVEGEREVRVALTRDMHGEPAGPCAGVGTTERVQVTLEQPLGSRVVVDTSLCPPLVISR